MVKDNSRSLMEMSILGNGRMEGNMDKEHGLGMMETSMKVNGRLENQMVKGHTLTLMEGNQLVSTEMINHGMLLIMTKMGQQSENGLMG